MGTRRGQKPSLVLVVAEGGLEVCYSPVCAKDSVSSVWKIHSYDDFSRQ